MAILAAHTAENELRTFSIEGGKNKTGRFQKKSEILALFGGALMISHTPFFYSPIRRASILDVNDDKNKTGRFQRNTTWWAPLYEELVAVVLGLELWKNHDFSSKP